MRRSGADDEREVDRTRGQDGREVREVRLAQREERRVLVRAEDENGVRAVAQRHGQGVAGSPARGRPPPGGRQLADAVPDDMVERKLRAVAQRTGDGEEDEAEVVAVQQTAIKIKINLPTLLFKRF